MSMESTEKIDGRNTAVLMLPHTHTHQKRSEYPIKLNFESSVRCDVRCAKPRESLDARCEVRRGVKRVSNAFRSSSKLRLALL